MKMNFGKVRDEVIRLKIEGYPVMDIVDYLAREKQHHFAVAVVLMKQFGLKKDEVQKILLENAYFFEQMSEFNPFNEEFIKIMSMDED